MKEVNKLVKEWKKFLLKEDKDKTYQIYCDMDGVLVDLVGAVLQTAQKDTENEKLRKGVEKILAIDWRWTEKNPKYQRSLDYIDNMVSNDVEFWATLPPTSDKDVLWGYISQYDPIILSHPWDGESAEGKRVWVSNLIDPQPIDVILTGDKHRHATTKEGKPNILIDDFEKYTVPWEQAGGIAILHTSAEDTINKLKALMEQ